ncbi:hypothetical protein BSKO_09121 [Bryopsis sp. KO-2023]|nr:hypothetical protein BSKO_09121 [Bryopsis sp. KO-2023]
MAGGMELSLSNLADRYSSGSSPKDVISEMYGDWSKQGTAFIFLSPLETLLERCDELLAESVDARGPLWGVPFAVKDNIDVASMPTTAACPEFEYIAEKDARCVERLLAAGGIMVGKTNMDQFACGLVGTRSPFGTAKCAFDSRFIPGGSSSGSGALVGSGLVSFALGTDTAGSGRVPAMFNGCVGAKPTVGKISTEGVVPACRSLDCVSVFATCVEDAGKVVEIMSEFCPSDPTQRNPAPTTGPPVNKFKFAVPNAEFLNFGGSGGQAVAKEFERLFSEAIDTLTSLGGEKSEIDFSSFAEIASLLYGGAFVSERISGVEDFLKQKTQEPNLTKENLLEDDRMLAVTRKIFSGGAKFSAVDLFNDFAKLSELRAKARVEFDKIDVLLVPTAASHYTLEEIRLEEEPQEGSPNWTSNANLGRFTNFVNMMDLCGIAVPSGKYNHPPPGEGDENLPRYSHLANGDRDTTTSPLLPFGITLLASAWSDKWLWDIAAKFQDATGLGCGPKGHNSTI